MLFHLRLTKNYRMIFQIFYKQQSKAFNMSTNSWYRVNGMSNKFDSSIIKSLYLFEFNQALWFNFKNLANCFRKFFIK